MCVCVYMCMCVYIYIYINAVIYMCVWTRVCVYICVSLYINILYNHIYIYIICVVCDYKYIYMYVCLYKYIYIYIYIYIYMCVCECVCLNFICKYPCFHPSGLGPKRRTLYATQRTSGCQISPRAILTARTPQLCMHKYPCFLPPLHKSQLEFPPPHNRFF